MASGDPIQVLIVDDEQMVAEALALSLGRERDVDVVGLARSVAEAERLLHRRSVDVVLSAYQLPDGDGILACARFQAILPRVRVLLLGASTQPAAVRKAVEAGCSGFVTRADPLATLARAIRAAATGQTVFTPVVVCSLVESFRTVPTAESQELTAREFEVLGLLATGHSTDGIVEELHLSPHTVRNHIRNILEKVGAHSRLEAVAVATREGLITVNEPTC
jgi:DNA-binding NarL/FixJ family response regulator